MLQLGLLTAPVFIDPRSPEPLAFALRELSSGASLDAPEHAPLTPQFEFHDAPIMELHSTRVQGSTCKHAAIPTGLSRRCDWVVMNETSEGLIKYRSPPRCVSNPCCLGTVHRHATHTRTWQDCLRVHVHGSSCDDLRGPAAASTTRRTGGALHYEQGDHPAFAAYMWRRSGRRPLQIR